MSTKYNKIGIDYNRTRRADTYLTSQLIRQLQPKQNGTYLDIGCGTGNYTSALQKQGYSFIGIDPSQLMLEKARIKNPKIDWRIGSAEKTGLSNNAVDGIIASLTIHHWTDLNKSFLELNRVLKPTGRIVLFTSTPQQMKGYWLHHFFPKMLSDSMIQMPTLETVKQAMISSGIKVLETHKYFIQPELEDHFLYCGKHNPELYFNEQIRRGISSFSSLSNQSEVEKGLTALRKAIESVKIKDIIQSYENDMGDYLFIIGRKAEASRAS